MERREAGVWNWMNSGAMVQSGTIWYVSAGEESVHRSGGLMSPQGWGLTGTVQRRWAGPV